ncbi:hypothetical protein [Pseudomonas mosselii]|uniref:Uncharacterized protein n=3 Tax=Pseudomonas mosselii TaxID=78327 RepID=A0ABX9B5Y1_9PSED|nr:hypothetical protein [Pseudomonas mosselii]MCL8301982.1 hypothetical protein [Pseudomonas mosselii]MCL8342843.1 hypothetical protein [Pseudomonas mosselii]MCU9530936.1 hypothetical protein [Pseudomonas mosselii]MCU9535979.1 hypothetical protein [Pseudomonas mosselii]MCU9541086.1 hypothetical protein [Pseudomonas mosselii]
MQGDEKDGVKQMKKAFFALPHNKDVIRQGVVKLKEQYSAVKPLVAPKKAFTIKFVISLLFSIDMNSDVFDACCRFNIDGVGEQFLRRVEELRIDDEIALDELFSLAYRFAIELKLVSPSAISDDLSSLIHEIPQYTFAETSQSQIMYAEHQMVIGVVGMYLHHPDMVDLKRLPAVVTRSEEERAKAERMLAEKEARVEALRAALEKYEIAYNFVGLYDGFKMLRSQKMAEGHRGLMWLFSLGVLMLAPFVFKFYTVFDSDLAVKFDVYVYGTVVGFELLLAYFFRVGLHGYRAVKAQLIQIDLRMALCQFIQNYAEYAKDIRKDSPDLLDRFDQLIFSGIVNNEGAIPSTFDGMEQIANVLDKLKSK